MPIIHLEGGLLVAPDRTIGTDRAIGDRLILRSSIGDRLLISDRQLHFRREDFDVLLFFYVFDVL